MKELIHILKARTAHPNQPFALATVVRVEGGCRHAGARMLIDIDGHTVGSIGGGSVQNDVIAKGLEVLVSRENRLMSYDVLSPAGAASDATVSGRETVDVLIEALLPENAWSLEPILDQILHDGSPLVLGTLHGKGETGLTLAHSFLENDEEVLINFLNPDERRHLKRQMREVAETGKSQSLCYGDSAHFVELFLEKVVPPPELFIFGTGEDVRPLVQLAHDVGYRVTIVDHREEEVDPLRFLEADAVLHVKPHHILEQLAFTPRSAAIIMNHCHETDCELLGILLPLKIAYLGMVGPKKKTKKILQELEQNRFSFSPQNLEKLHAPAGLDIGSESPEELALSILAEIQAALSAQRSASLREHVVPIAPEPFLPRIRKKSAMLQAEA